jgi:hypothetical protein
MYQVQGIRLDPRRPPAELGLPVRFIGVGEGIDDLIPFTPEGYVEELLPRQWKH